MNSRQQPPPTQTPESTGTPFLTWLIPVVLAVIAAAAGVAALKPDKLVTVGLFIAAAVPLIIAFTPIRASRVLQVGWPAVLTLVLVVAGLGTMREKPPEEVVGPPPSPSAAASTPSLSPIKFVPPDGSISHCIDLVGTGEIPPGQRLAIFDRELAEPNASFWFNKLAEATPTGWSAKQVQIGDGPDNGKRVQISAVLLAAEYADYLASITADELWWAPRLPAQASDTLTVERNADTRPCK